LASRHTEKLNTFSIGYRDEPFFDETRYAELVAAKFRTNHTTFKLTNDDLYGHLHNVLEYLDEPFADSSALPVYILSKHTREKATVALSGDGADELFGGYNKHAAHLKALDPGIAGSIAKSGKWVLKAMPKSRKSGFLNKMRQADRFAEGLRLNDRERYWRWCSVCNENNALELLQMTTDLKQYAERKGRILNSIADQSTINDILYTDMKLVLPGDMLTKVDLMSMANSLEVRTPFLDHEIVDFVINLSENFKIRKDIRKRLLQDTFRDDLPEELYRRPKKGFEVPLEKWLKSDLNELIRNDLLAKELIMEQGIFRWENVEKVLNRFTTNDAGDSAAQIWGLVVFQSWWKKYFHLSTKYPV
ncbi:MAG: asparagine synthase C-terminal domain-containing protein, partial [Bacteroidota bacterium]